MNKSYNPFKMWMSYVGAGIGLLQQFLPDNVQFLNIVKYSHP